MATRESYENGPSQDPTAPPMRTHWSRDTDRRYAALDLAIRHCGPDKTPDSVTDVAASFYRFLQGGQP